VEKRWNTKTDLHPWRAFSNAATGNVFLGAFYDDEELKRYNVVAGGGIKGGGRKAAVDAVLAYTSV
jgi:hypothetical protein